MLKNEDQVDKYLQRIRNKIMHAKCGNRGHSKPKKHYKILQINTRNGAYKSSKDLLRLTIDDHNPDIAIVSESNISKDEPNIDVDFKEYEVENKFMTNMDVSRTTIFIKKSINYQRVTELEEDDLSAIFIRIKLNNKRSLYILGMYRQWGHLAAMCKPDSHKTAAQCDRFTRLMSKVEPIPSKNNSILIGGDINVDLYPPNNPTRRHIIKKLTDIYNDVINLSNLCQMNFEPTRYQGQSKSLLDHYFTNSPDRVDAVQSLPSHIADHWLVKLQFHVDILQSKPQFREVRNFAAITPASLCDLLEMNVNLNSIFKSSCPNKVMNIIVDEYNSVINTLAPPKLIQTKKNDSPYATEEVREAKEEANQSLFKSIRMNDTESWRLYKRAKNQFSKIVLKAKKSYY